MTNDATLLIRDLVEAPEIRTVIQLQDLTDPILSRMIRDTFVITGEVLDNLKSVFASLCGRQGQGSVLTCPCVLCIIAQVRLEQAVKGGPNESKHTLYLSA